MIIRIERVHVFISEIDFMYSQPLNNSGGHSIRIVPWFRRLSPHYTLHRIGSRKEQTLVTSTTIICKKKETLYVERQCQYLLTCSLNKTKLRKNT